MNLNALVLLYLKKVKFVDLDNNEDSIKTPTFMVKVILSWFWCMGVSIERVKKWIKKSFNIDFEIPPEIDTTCPTLAPLPSLVDVTYKITNTNLILFGKNKDECLYTIQVKSFYF